jgi:hypothetical protein
MTVTRERAPTQDSPARSEGEAPGANPPRGFRRLFGSKLFTSFSGFLGGLVVAVAAPLIVAAMQEPPKRVVVQRPPVAVVETQREALAEAGVVNPVQSPGMSNLGVSITADIVTSGYTGKTLEVDCEVYAVYPHPGFRKTEQVSFTGISHPQVTAPCWIPLPSFQHPRRYNAVILRVGPVGGSRQRPTALPVTPFVAPPVPSPQ